MKHSCLDCNYHGPPISSYKGEKPCGKCIQTDGSKQWKPVTDLPAPPPPKENEYEW